MTYVILVKCIMNRKRAESIAWQRTQSVREPSFVVWGSPIQTLLPFGAEGQGYYVADRAAYKDKSRTRAQRLPFLAPSQPQRSRGPMGQVDWRGPAAPPAAWPFLLLFPPPASVSGIACASVSQSVRPVCHRSPSNMKPKLQHSPKCLRNCLMKGS